MEKREKELEKKKEANQSKTDRKESVEKKSLVVMKTIHISCYDCYNTETVLQSKHDDKQRRDQEATPVMLDLCSNCEYNVCINTSSESIVLEEIRSYDIVKKCDHVCITSISNKLQTKLA